MAKKNNSSNKKRYLIIGLLVSVFIGVTYAWLAYLTVSKDNNTVTVGKLSFELKESSAIYIEGEKGIPMTREMAISDDSTLYTFELTNTGNIDSEYKIYLDIENENGPNVIPSSYIRYIIAKEKQTPENKNLPINETSFLDDLISNAPRETADGADFNKVILDSSYGSNVLKPNQTNKYSLRLWIDKNAKIVNNLEFRSKLKVVATQTNIDD